MNHLIINNNNNMIYIKAQLKKPALYILRLNAINIVMNLPKVYVRYLTKR